MANLSDLLNPAPTSQQSAPVQQAPQPSPLVLDGLDHRADRQSSLPYASTGSPTRNESLTSPGLEALATAASNIAPLRSPTQHNTPHTNSAFRQHSLPQYSPRPQSSHSLPPLSHDVSHSSGQLPSSHTSSLEQYHHPSTTDRKTSNMTDDSSQIPPLFRGSLPGSVLPMNGEQLENENSNLHEREHNAMGLAPAQELKLENIPQQQDHVPATSQIRPPSPTALPSPSHPAPQGGQHEQVQVKTEMNEVPVAKMQDDVQVSEQTTDVAQKIPLHPHPSGDTFVREDDSIAAPAVKPNQPPSRKRPAPKKGTAITVKPPAKKRKVDTDSIDRSPSTQRVGTPTTSRASMTPAPKNRKQTSVTPTRSSSVANGNEDEEYDDGTELFCICRKPDDNTPMIGCDGPCEDWFHFRCVEMNQEKCDLVSKWFCPSCTSLGNDTLWLRKCRLESCQKPANVRTKSKYCTAVHGEEYMMNRTLSGAANKEHAGSKSSNRKKRQNNYTDNHGNLDDFDYDDDRAYLRGGLLKAGELKALADGVGDHTQFKRLGDGILTPTNSNPGPDGVRPESISYTSEESAELAVIAIKKEDLLHRKTMLSDRDKFIGLVTARGKIVLARLKEKDKSIKDICGYDTRLTWSDDQFNQWRDSPEGQKALNDGTLEPPTKEAKPDDAGGAGPNGDGAVEGEKEGEKEDEVGRGVCKKRRCERHKSWLKLQLQDNAFEKDHVRQGLKKLEVEEKGFRDRAMIRILENGKVEE